MDLQVANLAAYLGAAIAMGFGAIGAGWGIGYAGVGAARGMAKQPVKSSAAFRNMLIGQAIASNPSIFALVIAFVLYMNGSNAELATADSFVQAGAFLGAGISIGFCAVGAGAGNGIVAADAIMGISRNPVESGQVTVMMVVSQAVGQTLVLFGLVVSLMLLYTGDYGSYVNPGDVLVHTCRLLAIGMSMGFGGIGAGLSSSYAGARLCESMALTPTASTPLKSAYFVGSAVSQGRATFSFVFAMILFTLTS